MLQGHKIAPARVRLSFVFTLLALVALLTPARLHASASDHLDQAVEASKAWVAEIDAARYEDTYTFLCEETRNRYSEDHWVQVLQTFRTPWGRVIDRHQLSHIYKPNGVKGLEGECVIITYFTNFKNQTGVRETVALKWEDGQWRGAGYIAGVPPDPNAAAPDDGPTTDVQTHEHVKLQPNSP